MKWAGNRILGNLFFRLLVVFPLLMVVVIPMFVLGVSLAAYLVYSVNLPEIPELKNYQPRTVSTFYSDDGTVIGIFYKQKRFVVEIEQIPQHVINAFLAAEDADFYNHNGVDWPGLVRATMTNLKTGKFKQGASTITMQVTRNFLLTQEKRMSRKIKEIILARQLERIWGKEKILYVYLNEIYLGDGCYGVEAAARNYFDKPVEHLTVAEAALIAGLIASPSNYNPFKNEKAAYHRQAFVLKEMRKKGFITEDQFNSAKSRKLVFRKEIRRPFDLVPDFAEAVRRYVIDKYGADALYNQGLKVFTTCRVEAQKAAVDAVKKGLAEIKGRHKHFALLRTVDPEYIPELLEDRSTPRLTKGKLYQGVVTKVIPRSNETRLKVALSKRLRGRVKLEGKRSDYRVGQVLALRFDGFVDRFPMFTPDEHPDLQGALVCIENKTGYVRAIVGGSSDEKHKFNRAVQAKRQPGSAFKPIIYSVAIEKNSYSPATIIIDEPIIVDVGDEEEVEEWVPKNAGGRFHGPISLRRALELSRNICTIKILMDVTLEPVIKMARRLGITSRLGRNLSLSLGTSEVTLFELTSAYTVFPNAGIHVEPVLVKRIEDRHGNVLEDNTEIPMVNDAQIPFPEPRQELKELDQPVVMSLEDEFVEEDIKEETAPDTDSGETESSAKLVEDLVHGDMSIAGESLIAAEHEPEPREVAPAMSPETAYIMTNLLQGGVRSGTGRRLKKYLDRQDLAGKTGTTNNAEDTWFMGFNPDYTTGVWVGFDEKRPLGKSEHGAKAALPIWGYFMRELLKDMPEREFPVPPNVEFAVMTTYAGNSSEGFYPKTVEEPVYAPFMGRTLVLCPVDTPELLREYTSAQVPTQPEMRNTYVQSPGGYPPGGRPAPPVRAGTGGSPYGPFPQGVAPNQGGTMPPPTAGPPGAASGYPDYNRAPEPAGPPSGRYQPLYPPQPPHQPSGQSYPTVPSPQDPRYREGRGQGPIGRAQPARQPTRQPAYNLGPPPAHARPVPEAYPPGGSLAAPPTGSQAGTGQAYPPRY